MLRRKNKSINEETSQERLTFLQKFSLFFFRRPKRTALLWVMLLVFGIASYTTLLKREGFPAVETPFAIANGAYLVNDPAKVDREVAQPLSRFLLEQPGVDTVQTSAQANFFVAQIGYAESVNAQVRSQELANQIRRQNLLPKSANFELKAFELGFTTEGDDLVVSFYSKNQVPTAQLAGKAKQAAEFFKYKNIPGVKNISVIDPFKTAVDPDSGQSIVQQQTFDRYGQRQNGQTNFYKSIVIGFDIQDGVDNIELDDHVQAAVNELNNSPDYAGYQTAISASYAPDIKAQVNELQQVLLEGLAAILVIGSIVIAIRASLLTVLSLVTVLAVVNGLLYALGYTLNTITLFALILGLALMIDDTIIMVEALDAQRRKLKRASDAVKVATRKVSRAMIAATLTAILSFTPLLFVGGILGDFIKAIPVTIISALLVSLFVALVFIPLFARAVLLNKKSMGEKNVREFSTNLERKIAEFIIWPMLWARKSKAKLASVSLSAILISFIFIGAGGYLFTKVSFNIFPSSKDTNGLITTLNFPPNTSLDQAETAVDAADQIVSATIGDNLEEASYYAQADNRSATLNVRLIDYKDRDIRSPEIVAQLEDKFTDFDQAKVIIRQLDPGPPAAAFSVRVDSSTNRDAALKLADDIQLFLKNTQLQRIDGSTAEIKTASVSNDDVFSRADGQAYVEATAEFEDNDISTLVTLAQTAVEKEFPPQRVAGYGLNKNAVSFNAGQEDENQNSFATLAYAFPIVLVAIFILLAIQFRSLLQPLLIFMAIPFSLFGISLGLFLTDNPFSFFALLGFFALIGLSLKNTILLVDYANQSRRAGKGPVDAAHDALAERFRPLVATSLTAVVSLIPLSLTSPFWEGLSVVLMFGLLSSTFLVITVFPYFYLAGEFARGATGRTIKKLIKKLKS